jgi:hypothetical protein
MGGPNVVHQDALYLITVSRFIFRPILLAVDPKLQHIRKA